MTEADKILVVIPARGGSKRLARKNMLPLAGKPLICWTIEAALEANLKARILVTSDDKDILDLARQYEGQGVIPHKRPDELATDSASTADVLLDAVNAEKSAGHTPESLVLLQPTSPLRKASDILSAVSVYCENGWQETVVTVCEVDHPTAWVGKIGEASRLEGLDLSGTRSQDYVKEYRLNGAVYVASVGHLLTHKTVFTDNLIASVMPRERSVDIDARVDLMMCESLIADDSGCE